MRPQTESRVASIASAIDALILFARHLRTLPEHEVEARLPELETHSRNLSYYCIYGQNRRGASIDPPHDPSALVARRCSITACYGGPILFNIAFQRREIEWRCLAHIPREITFPVGLFNDEWRATGRK